MYCETGGIRFGQSFWISSNLTFPFARIAITPGSIVIHSGIGSFFKREFRFKKTDISEISKKRGLFSTGLQIKHTVENLPGFILFWTFHYSRLKEAVEENGFLIAE